ncbi:MAG: class I SAM-dependent methyltransferase [Aggregatilineales bacterium]
MAARYASDIAPLVGPLANSFIDSIPAACIGKQAVDIGTGTGLAARCLVERGASQVVGIDILPSMLRQSLFCSEGVQYVLADVCYPPFAPASFDLIVASFGLALTPPHRSLSQIWKLLKPGGWLFFQEWAAQDSISRAFDEIFAVHTALESVNQRYADLPTEWTDQLQDSEDYKACLTRLGFSEIQAVESALVSIRASIESFIRYKFAWPTYRADWLALDLTARTALDSTLRTRLADFAEPDGALIWQPSLFRVSARRSL